jgi:hypothetical protein
MPKFVKNAHSSEKAEAEMEFCKIDPEKILILI